MLSIVLKCRTSLAEVDLLSEHFLRFANVAERVSVMDDFLEQRFGASRFSYFLRYGPSCSSSLFGRE